MLLKKRLIKRGRDNNTEIKSIADLMNEARLSQVHSFKQSIGNLVAHDTAICNMPRIRITAAKN